MIKKLFFTITLLCIFVANAFGQSMLNNASTADALYKEGKFAQALYIYNNIAAEGNSSNDKRINELNNRLKDETVGSEQFQACILEGNAALKEKEYEKAYICFQASLLIKPDANFPKTKLKDLAQYIQDPSIEKEFLRLKKIGDDYFDEREFELADKMYNDALVLKPGNKDILDKKVEIEKVILQQGESKRQYDDYIFKADRFFQNGDYNNADENYRLALQLFPKETYPKEKLNEILSISADNEKREEDYAKAIENGDKAFNEGKYQEAQDYFTNALALKPTEQYPNTKLLAINEVLSKINAKDDEVALIRENIKSNIAAEQYNIALSHIQSGLRILPTDPEFIEQRSFVDSIMTKRNIDNSNYDNYISLADDFFKDKNYAEAKRYYSRANDIKFSNNIAAKIVTSDSLMNLAAIKPIEITKENNETTTEKPKASTEDKQKYKEAITRGDNKFKRKDYDGARVEYLDALKFVPEDSYTKSKITEIDTIISRNLRAQAEVYEKEMNAYKAQQEQVAAAVNRPPDFNKIVSEGKNFYYRKNYDKALNSFNKCLEIDPNDEECIAYKDSIVLFFNNNVARALATSPELLGNGQKKKYNFTKLTPSEIKNCYLAIIISTAEQNAPKVYLNYFQGATKKGGFVIKDIQENKSNKEIYIRLSDIVAWQR
ncbi:tetratricopeptide repeat protein, partial [Bacteroidales bacterium OttesenSCG-928-L14]|nr:tetratricopeptide repeat protein [Bacteroidales bacterium OttesenSCG-928-L14]